MHIDPAVLSSVSALMGAFVGGGASLGAAVYTHRSNDRLQRVEREVTKREAIYADFIMSASNLLLIAYLEDEIKLNADVQRLVGLINRMRLFAPKGVITEADAVIRALIEISLKPGVELRQLAKEALSRSPDPDSLRNFSIVCQADLDNVRRTLV
jgi:hypothetical protein